MTALIKLIEEVKNQILKFNEYDLKTPLIKIIKDKKITYIDKELNQYYSTEDIVLAFNYFYQRGKYNLIYCISVPEEFNFYDGEKNFNLEELRNEDDIRYEAKRLNNTYEGWINEEENDYIYRESKKKESIEFLLEYYSEVLKK